MVFVSHYDQTNQMFTFVNDDFDLGTMFSEVQRIKILRIIGLREWKAEK